MAVLLDDLMYLEWVSKGNLLPFILYLPVACPNFSIPVIKMLADLG